MLDDDTRCYRHEKRVAAVTCQRCDKPICSLCMTEAPVGFHCPDCVKSSGQRVIPARSLRSRTGTPVVMALIGINVAFFLAQQAIRTPVAGYSDFTDWGLLFGPAVHDGEWWRIVTSAFLHENLLHIGFNMYALWIFGPPLERFLGPVRFALAYLAGLLGGAVAVLAFNYGAPTLGASGAVLGLAAALAAVLWSRGVKPTQTSLMGIFVLNLLLPVIIGGISFWGHLGGIVGGFLAGWLLSWLPDRYRAPMGTAVSATVALCVVLAMAAVAVALAGAAGA